MQKFECVAHVQKRMGKRLCDLKKNAKGRTLADGKSIGGRGKLTDMEIKKNTGILLQRHQRKHKQSCWDAVCCLGIFFFFHKLSTDEKPCHNFCLRDWCPYKQAEATGTLQTFNHTNNLPEAIMEEVRPIFKDLARTEFLRKCELQ